MIYDLIIIGGGMSGISVAHFFRDWNILILEKGELLSGATGQNAGFLIGGFGEHFARTVARLGLAIACEIQEIHRANHRRIRELAQKMDCSYNATGSLTTWFSIEERKELRESYELMRKAGFPVEWQEKADTGLRDATGALLNPEDAWIDPVEFWSKLAQGLPLRTQTEVLHVENRDNGIEATTAAGVFYAQRVVFCLDAFAGTLVPELQGRFIPLRGQLLEINIDRFTPTLPVIADHGDIYWRFEPQKLIFGGLESSVPSEETGIAKQMSEEIQRNQRNWIQEHFAYQIQGAPKSRFSTMAFTLDGFPFVGMLPQENRYVLSGTCGLGHSYTLEAAAWLHSLIASNENRIPPYLSSDRIDKLPVYTGGNWRSLYEAWNH